MIPVPITELEPYVISNERNKKYKEVILGELRYINNNSEKIMKNAEIVYKQKLKNEEIGYIKNTVNFKLLEEKLKEWNESYGTITDSTSTLQGHGCVCGQVGDI